MVIDRPQAKQAARNLMRTARVSPYQIGLIYVIIVFALSAFEQTMLQLFGIPDVYKRPAKGVGRETGARVQIPPSAPQETALFVGNRAVFFFYYVAFALEKFLFIVPVYCSCFFVYP